MRIVFTDLDGTLLDHDTYEWSAAQPALEGLERRGIPVLLVSSKTRAEIEMWREQMKNRHPFIVENGGAIFLPRAYFGSPIPTAIARGGYEMIALGDPSGELRKVLREASRTSGVAVRTLEDMSDEEVAQRTALRPEQVPLARRREFGMPFVIQEEAGADRLLGTIDSLGKRWTRGGRFHHILGNSDKARAVEILAGLFSERHKDLVTAGLGDAPNDLAFLRMMDQPVIIRSRFADRMQAELPRAYVTTESGPAGWNEAMFRLVLNRESAG